MEGILMLFDGPPLGTSRAVLRSEGPRGGPRHGGADFPGGGGDEPGKGAATSGGECGGQAGEYLTLTSFCGSSCASNGKDALNTPETLPGYLVTILHGKGRVMRTVSSHVCAVCRIPRCRKRGSWRIKHRFQEDGALGNPFRRGAFECCEPYSIGAVACLCRAFDCRTLSYSLA
eukprot:1195212-Prorocentrum_minimum.AAC.9